MLCPPLIQEEAAALAEEEAQKAKKKEEEDDDEEEEDDEEKEGKVSNKKKKVCRFAAICSFDMPEYLKDLAVFHIWGRCPTRRKRCATCAVLRGP